ncbi:MAG: hypothetical protein JST92_24320 [Deltaproteobacteria bacterium]|nr:hypothetical protein [Deltaproteobacteria bacterium]
MRQLAVVGGVRLIAALSALLLAASPAHAAWTVLRITSGVEARERTDGAQVYRDKKLLGSVAVGMQLQDGDSLKVLAAGLTVLLQGPPKADGSAGDRIAVEGREEGVAEQIVGGAANSAGSGSACWLRSGRAYFQIVPDAARRFLCFFGAQDRKVPVGVKGTQFSLEVRDDGTSEVVVAQGVVAVGEPGTALYREIAAGKRLQLEPGGAREGELDREVRVRIEGALTRVEVDEKQGGQQALMLMGEDGAWEERTVRHEERRVTGSLIHAPGDAAAAQAAAARWRAEGKRAVDALDRQQLWAVADELYAGSSPDFELALELYLRASKLPGFTPAEVAQLQVNAARCQLELRRFSAAEALLREAQRVIPDDPSLLSVLAQALLGGGASRDLEAAELLARLRASPGSAGLAYHEAGALALRMSRLSEARRQLSNALEAARRAGTSQAEAHALLELGSAVVQTVSTEAALIPWTLAREELERLTAAQPKQDELAAALAETLLRVGDVLLVQGKSDEAAKTFARSLQQWERLTQVEPARAEWQRGLSGALVDVGDAQELRGQSAEALVAYRRALAVREPLAKAESKPGPDSAALAQVVQRLADALVLQGKSEEALRLHQRALELRESLLRGAPGDAERILGVNEAQLKLGALLALMGRGPEALDMFRRGLAQIEPAAAAAPKRRELQRALARSLEKLGGQLEDYGNTLEALDACQRAMGLSERLVRAEPARTDLQWELSLGQAHVAKLLRLVGRREDAAAMFGRVLETRERLAQAEPGRTDLMAGLADALQESATQARQQGHKDDARALLRRALEVRERQVKAEPARADLKAELANALDALGEASPQGTSASAGAFEQALSIREALARAQPERPDLQRDLAQSYENTGETLLAQGKTADAMARFRLALEINERMALVDPGRTAVQKQLGVTRERLGAALTDKGTVEGTIDLYRRTLASMEALALAEPARKDLQSDLSWALNRQGDALLKDRRAAEALPLYRRALEIRMRLAAAEPADAKLALRVDSSLLHVHDALAMLRKRDEALEVRRRSVALREGLARAEPANLGRQRSLASGLSTLAHELRQFERKHDQDSDEPQELRRRVLELRRSIAAAQPDDVDAQEEVADALMDVADGLPKDQVHVDQGLVLYRQARDLLERLLAQHPDDDSLRGDLGRAWERIAIGLRFNGESGESAELYEQAQQVDEKLARKYPHRYVLEHNRAVGLLEMGDVLLGAGQEDEGRQLGLRGMEIMEGLIFEHPFDSNLEEELGSIYGNVVRLLRHHGRDAEASELTVRSMIVGGDVMHLRRKPDDALTMYSKALELGEEAMKHDSQNASLQARIGTTYAKRAEVLDELGRKEQALAAYQLALSVRGRQTALQTSQPGPQRELASVLSRMGDVQTELGRPDDALESWRRATEAMLRWRSLDPISDAPRELAEVLRKQAMTLRGQGKLDEALAASRRSIELLEASLKELPDRAELQVALSLALLNAGDLLRAQHKDEEALPLYLRSLELREALARAVPWRVDYAWSRSVSLERLGSALLVQGKRAEAMERFEQSRQVLEALVTVEPGRADLRWALEKARKLAAGKDAK